ncbi:hypothetical protein M0802_011130 [Mischocyttarus mexicanus]|nr:hypothetical protein M0802_011130 [Mischocyttarus mexicanus]
MTQLGGGGFGGSGGYVRSNKKSFHLTIVTESPYMFTKNDLAGPDVRGNTRLRQQQSISQPAQCQYMNMTDSLTE